MESQKKSRRWPYQADCQWGMPRNEEGARLHRSSLKDEQFAVLGEYEEVDRATEPGDGLGFAPGVLIVPLSCDFLVQLALLAA